MEYFQQLVEHVNLRLQSTNISLDQIGYALCLDKSIMYSLDLETKGALLDFVKDSYAVNFEGNPRKLIVVEQGERKVWELLQKTNLKPPSYYIHSHITDEYILMKLHQVVDTTESNCGLNTSSQLFIEDRVITMKNVYERISEILWNYIHKFNGEGEESFFCGNKSIDFVNDFTIFKKRMVQFLKEKVNQQLPYEAHILTNHRNVSANFFKNMHSKP